MFCSIALSTVSDLCKYLYSDDRPGVVKALEEFKLSIFGENYEESDLGVGGKGNTLAKKRKAEDATKESTNYDWSDLADNGRVSLYSYDLLPTSVELVRSSI